MLAVIGAVLFGLIFGIGRLLPNIVIRAVSGAIVEFARAVPVLLLMIFFWRWFAFAGMSSPAYWAVVPRIGDLQRFRGGRAGSFRCRQPAERPA